MKSKSWFAVAGALVALSFSAPQTVHAQDQCVQFRGIIQSRFDPGLGWIGTFYGFLGEEHLTGVLVGAKPGTSTQNGVIGRDIGVVVTWEYTSSKGSVGTLTTEQNGLYRMPPNQSGLGYYQGIAKVLSGTGRFQNASGMITFGGPYALWHVAPGDPNSALDGRWNVEVSGRVCNVLPPT